MNQQFKLHLIPSGILYPNTMCIVANGVAVDMGELIKELDELQSQGIDTKNLRISRRAPLVMPYHKRIDSLEDRAANIGTTKRGIGPTYADKINRIGFRIGDLLDSRDYFEPRFAAQVKQKNRIIEEIYGEPGFDYRELLDELMEQVERLRPYIADTSLLIYEAMRNRQKVLFEGAQGTLLDIDHGTYPFVTSSHPIAGGACVGAGVGPTCIDRVLGVAKAYTTRVGEGPFPTELKDAEGDMLQQRGMEFGTTTGRKRRCGWLDAVILRYAVRLNGLTDLAITKLDVLDEFPAVKICTAYKYKGTLIDEFPESIEVLEGCQPVYMELPGWQEDISHITAYDQLPPNARRYLETIYELTGVRQTLISVGPKRSQTIVQEQLFD